MKLIKENWAIIVLCAFAMYIMYESSSKVQQYEKELKIFEREMDSIQHANDSLRWELLPTQIELGRYQVAFSIFSERNPKAAEEYGTIISEETE